MKTVLEYKARIILLEIGLQNLINCAECCDGWESFPQEELDRAEEILNDGLSGRPDTDK